MAGMGPGMYSRIRVGAMTLCQANTVPSGPVYVYGLVRSLAFSNGVYHDAKQFHESRLLPKAVKDSTQRDARLVTARNLLGIAIHLQSLPF